MSNSGPGNLAFRGVTNAAGQFQKLATADITASSAEIGLLDAYAQPFLGFNRITYVGYVPTTFATAAVNSIYSLNKAPGLTTATALTALTLPALSVVINVRLTNNGTVITNSSGSATYTMATGGLNAAPSATTAVMLTSAPIANVNASTGALTSTGVAGNYLIGAFYINSIVSPDAGQNYVNVTTLIGNNLTGGGKAYIQCLVTV